MTTPPMTAEEKLELIFKVFKKVKRDLPLIEGIANGMTSNQAFKKYGAWPSRVVQIRRFLGIKIALKGCPTHAEPTAWNQSIIKTALEKNQNQSAKDHGVTRQCVNHLMMRWADWIKENHP